MAPFEKLRREDSAVSLLFWTAFLVAIQTILSISAIVSPTIAQISGSTSSTPQYAIILFPTDPLIMAVYIGLPIILCTVFSMYLFHPKRIVSPLNVSIGTITVVTISITNKMANLVPSFTSTQLLQIMGTGVVFCGMLLITLALVQTAVVRWLVGGNLGKLDRRSYSINKDYETIARTVGGDFLRFWNFRLKHKTKECLVYKTRYPDGRTVVLAIGSNQKYKRKTILATVAFRTSFYGLESSDRASDLRDRIIRDLTGKLEENNSSLSISRLNSSGDRVSEVAYDVAIKPTLSKIEITREFFRKLPTYYKVAIAITFVALIGMTIGWWFKIGGFDSNTYIGSVVFILITFLFELGFSLRQEVSRKKEDLEY